MLEKITLKCYNILVKVNLIIFWPHSIVVSTPASHVGHMGSSPIGATIQ